MSEVSSRPQHRAVAGGRHVVDGEAARHDTCTEAQGSGVGECVVGEVGQHTAVDESVLLAESIVDVELQDDRLVVEMADPRAEHGTEGLCCEYFSGKVEEHY